MPVYRIQTYELDSNANPELVDILEFELDHKPASDSVFALLEAYHAERKREDESTVFQLVDILDELADLKQIPGTPFGHVLQSMQDLESHAKTARERIIRYAIQALDASSYDTVSDILEPASSILDRPDVKLLVDSNAPTHSPCGLPMSGLDTNTFAAHILTCRVCGDALKE